MVSPGQGGINQNVGQNNTGECWSLPLGSEMAPVEDNETEQQLKASPSPFVIGHETISTFLVS